MKSLGFLRVVKRGFLSRASRLLIGTAFLVGAFGRVDANMSEASQEKGVSYVEYGLDHVGLSNEEEDRLPFPGPLSQ